MAGVGGKQRRMTVAEWQEYERMQREKAEQVRTRYLISQYGELNNNQVAALSVKGSRAWLLQGPQLARSGI